MATAAWSGPKYALTRGIVGENINRGLVGIVFPLKSL